MRRRLGGGEVALVFPQLLGVQGPGEQVRVGHARVRAEQRGRQWGRVVGDWRGAAVAALLLRRPDPSGGVRRGRRRRRRWRRVVWHQGNVLDAVDVPHQRLTGLHEARVPPHSHGGLTGGRIGRA